MAHSIKSRFKLKSNDSSSSSVHSTPVKSITDDDKDYSPLFAPCTQESLDNIDVLWDWNSPQSKSRLKKKPKRIISNLKSSPKPPVRRTSQRIMSFDTIKDELLAFQEEIDSSPFKLDDSELVFNNNIDKTTNENRNSQTSDGWFDDSLEEELILVSQQVEEKFKHIQNQDGNNPNAEKFENNPNEEKFGNNRNQNEDKFKQNQNYVEDVFRKNQNLISKYQEPPKTPQDKKVVTKSPRTLTKSFSSNTFMDSPVRSTNVRQRPSNFHNKVLEIEKNDSFEVALQAFDEELIIPNIKKETKESFNNAQSSSAGLDKHSDNLRFKTKSLSFNDSYKKKSNQEILREEIEKKRLAALARLQAKKINLSTVLSDSDTSPIKCSPEEIELKRQQAIARLQEKKKQELIERNRQEALKKLEMKRNKFLKRPL